MYIIITFQGAIHIPTIPISVIQANLCDYNYVYTKIGVRTRTYAAYKTVDPVLFFVHIISSPV